MPYGIPLTRFARELAAGIGKDNVFNGAAALAYYLTLAIFPALIVTMAVIPFLPIPRVDQAIMDLVREALPASASALVADVVAQVMRNRSGGLLSFGLVATGWAASAGMYAIIQQLNVTYDVTEQRGFVKTRLVALGLTVLFVGLVIGALSLVVAGGMAQEWLGRQYGLGPAVLAAFATLRWIVIVAALMLAFALIYYLAPDVEQKFSFVTPGSVIGVLLLVLASVGLSVYTSNFADYNATYGSIGAVIVLMLWLYVTGLVILLGSEVNALVEHYAPKGKRKGDRTEGERPTREPPPSLRDDPRTR